MHVDGDRPERRRSRRLATRRGWERPGLVRTDGAGEGSSSRHRRGTARWSAAASGGPDRGRSVLGGRGRPSSGRGRPLRGPSRPPPRSRTRRGQPRRAHDARVGGAVRPRGGRGDGDGHPGRRVRARWPARDRDPRRRRARTTRGRRILGERRSVVRRACRVTPSAPGRCVAWASTPWVVPTSGCTAGSSRPGATRRSSPHEDRLVRPSPRLRPPHAPFGGASASGRRRGSQHAGRAGGPCRLDPPRARRRRRVAGDDRGRLAALGAASAPGSTVRAAAVSASIERDRPT